MNSQYADWIKNNVKDPHLNYVNYSHKMKDEFPELTIIKGYYCETPFSHCSPHCWLLDQDNNIVDPTISQYEHQNGEYFPLSEEEQLYNSRCLNCGEYFYSENGSQICSSYCDYAFRQSLFG